MHGLRGAYASRMAGWQDGKQRTDTPFLCRYTNLSYFPNTLSKMPPVVLDVVFMRTWMMNETTAGSTKRTHKQTHTHLLTHTHTHKFDPKSSGLRKPGVCAHIVT